MSHLSPEELLDLAEAARPEAASGSASHLAACAACRDSLADLREALQLVEPMDADVPEPSPLFWEHFSARVRMAIEAAPQPSWTERWLSWKVVWLPAAACLVLLTTAIMLRSPSAPQTLTEDAAVNSATDPVPSTIDEPSWTLMTDLAADLDWDAAIEAGLTPAPGGVDRAILDLSADERRELHRLVEQELSRSGA